MVQSPRKNSARLSAGPCRIRLRAFRLHPSPPRPLPSATPSLCNPFPPQPLPANCGPFRLSPLPLLAVEGRRGRETTVRFAWGPPAPCGSGWACMEKGGMTGGRRLPGLQGGLVAWRAAIAGAARENPGRAGRRTRLRITGRHRVTVRSSHGGRPGGESSATRCAVDIFLLILPS